MQEFFDSILDFASVLGRPILHVLSFLVIGVATLRLIDSGLKRIARIMPSDASHRRRIQHRTETLRHFVRSFGKAIIGVLMVILITFELGRDVTPVLAGAGIAGLAIGFGAQSLVKDVIAGFFVLLEDQYGVGEVVRIGTQEGTVEGMTLRVTVLRNADGEVHVIPNGSVQSVTVLSRDWRRALIEVELSSKEELGRVFNVLTRISEDLARDMSGQIIGMPGIIGIQRITGTGVTIQLAARTHPSKQGDVANQWRRRIKDTFDREGIRLAESLQVKP